MMAKRAATGSKHFDDRKSSTRTIRAHQRRGTCLLSIAAGILEPKSRPPRITMRARERPSVYSISTAVCVGGTADAVRAGCQRGSPAAGEERGSA